MAIAEAEPKKSEVAVAPAAGASHSTHANGINDLPTSSTPKSIKVYNLYDEIMDFSYHMPKGWNDKEIAIFLDSCREHISILRDTSIDERSKWKEIVESSMKKSSNPTLFTINSCMEVAQCIRQYVKRNEDYKGGKVFPKFCEDVKHLMEYFPPSPTEANWPQRSGESSAFPNMEELETIFPDDCNEEEVELSSSINKHLPAFKAGNPNVWNYISKDIKKRTNYDIDVQDYLQVLKSDFIYNIYHESDPEIRKDIFSKIRPYLLEIFDFIEPKSTSKEDIMNLISVPEKEKQEEASGKSEEHVFVSRKRTPGESRCSKSDDDVSSSESDFLGFESDEIMALVKKKRGMYRKMSGLPLLEPSSTTIVVEGAHADGNKIMPSRQTKERKNNFASRKKFKNNGTTSFQIDETLSPFVKLQIMEDSLVEKWLRKQPLPSTCSSYNDKGLTFSVPSAKPSIPAESAILGKDIIGNLYDPNIDSAKGPGSSSISVQREKEDRKKRRSERKGRPCSVPQKNKKRVKRDIKKPGRKCKSGAEFSSSSSNKGGQETSISGVVPEAVERGQPSESRRGDPSTTSMPTDVVSGKVSDPTLISQHSGMSEPSTSSLPSSNITLALMQSKVSDPTLSSQHSGMSEPSTSSLPSSNLTLALLQSKVSDPTLISQHSGMSEPSTSSLPSSNPSHGLSLSSPVIQWLHGLYLQMNRRRTENLNIIKEMHQETVNLEKEKIRLLKEVLEKLEKGE